MVTTMKPFDLEAAKNGAPVVTRKGFPVRIICFDRKQQEYPLIALILYPSGEEAVVVYTGMGLSGPKDFDLFMAPVKREGWINLYQFGVNLRGGLVYKNRELAIKDVDDEALVATVRIEWEE